MVQVDPVIEAIQQAITDHAEDLLRQLALPDGFYRHLLDEDDWSFIIKLNVLFEAACTQAIVHSMLVPGLEGFWNDLPFADVKSEKIRLLRDRGALTKRQASALDWLASTRNKLAHDIKYVSFSLQLKVQAFDNNQMLNFMKFFGPDNKAIEVGGKKVSAMEFVRQNPKLSIWLACIEMLACLALEKERAELERATIALKYSLQR